PAEAKRAKQAKAEAKARAKAARSGEPVETADAAPTVEYVDTSTAALQALTPDVPVMSRRARREAEAREAEASEPDELEHPTALQRGYLPVIHYTLKRPLITIGAAVLVLVLTGLMVPFMKTNFIGDSGQNTLTVTQELPLGSSLDAQDAAAATVEQALVEVDGVETVQLSLGSSGGSLLAAFGGSGGATFSITTDSDFDQEQLQSDVRAALAELEEVGEVSLAAAGSGFASTDIDVDVQAPGQQALQEAADAVLEEVRALDVTAEASSNLAVAQPYIAVVVNRAAAAERGLSEIAVGGIVSQAMLPRAEGTVIIDDKSMSIYIDNGLAPE